MVLTITRAWNKYISPDMRHGRAAALMIDGGHRRLGGVTGLEHGMGVGPAGGSTCSLSTHLRERSTDMFTDGWNAASSQKTTYEATRQGGVVWYLGGKVAKSMGSKRSGGLRG